MPTACQCGSFRPPISIPAAITITLWYRLSARCPARALTRVAPCFCSTALIEAKSRETRRGGCITTSSSRRKPSTEHAPWRPMDRERSSSHAVRVPESSRVPYLRDWSTSVRTFLSHDLEGARLVPELQRRRLLRREYEGNTLRGNSPPSSR